MPSHKSTADQRVVSLLKGGLIKVLLILRAALYEGGGSFYENQTRCRSGSTAVIKTVGLGEENSD